MLASRKKMHQDNLEDYINVTKELKDWSDEMNCSLKSVNVIEGKGHTIYERLDILNDMKSKLAAGRDIRHELRLNLRGHPKNHAESGLLAVFDPLLRSAAALVEEGLQAREQRVHVVPQRPNINFFIQWVVSVFLGCTPLYAKSHRR